MIVDHSIDLLSVKRNSGYSDLDVFLQILSLLPSSSSSTTTSQVYSMSEIDEELVFKEWLQKKSSDKNSFIQTCCSYLEDVVAIVKLAVISRFV